MKAVNLPYKPISIYKKVDVERARRISDEYVAMPNAPDDRKVRRSYNALIAETISQYQFVKKSGIEIELIPLGRNPYFSSPRLAILDVVQKNHLWVFPTDGGFGSTAEPSKNILRENTDEYIKGKRLCANDVFRIVHDYFGHVKEGVGFRANGEENAWRCHSTMYTRVALGALTTELRGQNSWLNYGPEGDKNRAASAENTKYAPQKNGLLPTWVWDEGRED